MSRTPLGLDRTKLRPQVLLYTALDDGKFDHSWYPYEVTLVRNMWAKNKHIADIAQAVKRDIDEVTVLLIDLSRKGKIDRRERGVYGRG